ncbi:pyridine nucleotide-disulfide oxidoreductase domain-containing protein 1 isoform X2 [Phymastichus coffea]|uniref:pyridine nucleotide-disulfide oxidoreductase domain-containing protein 1 isoform X2 n=1 Tax=Phymastichus coffea TaxID=108790 RepID=UPI00273C464F|nr:pyridine nucleotide-disulfide oxidoreductase domain-containing protein 1 isoform X2 [Phymastichus coffea]
MEATFVVIGGGIAGVSCAESIAFLAPEENVILISASPLIKAATNIIAFGKTLTQFDVEERSTNSLTEVFSSVMVFNDIVTKVDKSSKTVFTENGKIISYKKLCICTGARPKLICENNSRVIGIRDTESVETFVEKLKGSKRIIVVATFIDPGAAEFFQERLLKKENDTDNQPVKRMKYTITNDNSIKGGPALGPDWHDNFKFKKGNALSTVQVEYESEIVKIMDTLETSDQENENWPVYAQLTTGKIIGCDLIVSATGVVPNSNMIGLESLNQDKDGGYIVDWKLETSEPEIFAAGDVCSVGWEIAPRWFQMRLWTQAHQMGKYAAKSMVSTLKKEEFFQDFCFELFTHVTKFFGYKVVLLGLYNGQKLEKDYEILLRVTKGQEYVKLVVKNGKMQGAVLIGETDLEEMCENLILNQLDISMYGEDLLNPDIDIEDYFD